MQRRADILSATFEADRLHRDFGSSMRAKSGEGRVDVFRMLFHYDIPVIFRPLKNLLGAYLDNPSQGVIITTQRQLPVQRFTAAHELGHAVLGHETSLDPEDVLSGALFNPNSKWDVREIQANAFAMQLLTPQWLIVEHMHRQSLTRDNLTDPVVVYQLALRMGSSYTATCYALFDCKAIEYAVFETLKNIKPKDIKRAILAPYVADHWRRDVWLITERDNGMLLDGSRSDLVVFRVNEHASSGYVWQFEELQKAGLAIRVDEHMNQVGPHIGGVVTRKVVAEAKDGAQCMVSVRQVRPWQTVGEPLNSLTVEVNLSGPFSAGLLPREQEREILLEAA